MTNFVPCLNSKRKKRTKKFTKTIKIPIKLNIENKNSRLCSNNPVTIEKWNDTNDKIWNENMCKLIIISCKRNKKCKSINNR